MRDTEAYKEKLGSLIETIRSLKLSDYHKEDIIRAANNDPTLEDIGLYENDIEDEGAKALAEVLKHNTTLTMSWLDSNNIGDEGAKALAGALKHNTTLRIIDLSCNDIGVEGAKALAEALKHNTTLTEIHLGTNNIGDEGAKALAGALKHNTILTTIALGYNNIEDEGAKALAEALKHNTTLTEIHLVDNDIMNKESILDSICSLTRRNCQIRDAFRDYGTSILAPILLKMAATLQSEEVSIVTLTDLSRKILSTNLSLQEIIKFSEQWHSPLSQTKTLKLKNYAGRSWESLFLPHKEIPVPSNITEGWKLIALTTPEELRQEGKKLEHCVGGYTSKCLTENCHIISIANEQGESVATMEINILSGNKISVVQNYGKKNAPPCKEAQEIQAWLVKEVKENRLKLDFDALGKALIARIEEGKSAAFKNITYIGFDPDDREYVKKVCEVYKDILPDNKQIRANFQTMLGLQEIEVGGKNSSCQLSKR